MATIQLIEKQKGKFRININGVDCLFTPMELFVGDRLMPNNKVLKGSTLGWHINGKFVSYRQIKAVIKGYKK